jgi:ATP-dependent helicase/nuclease subunit B
MLRLISGRAKTGKTALIMREIGEMVRLGSGRAVLLVPEQYSHEAETELLRAGGDSLPLYAEVLSFKRLALRVLGETGGEGGTSLDKGGRLLCMALAVDTAAPRLGVYAAARRQAKLLMSLLDAVDELKSAHIAPDELLECAEKQGGMLAKKLRDLAVIAASFDAVVAAGRADPSDRLDVLAQRLAGSSFAGVRFYLDGFTDFTKQELGVIAAMLRCGSEVTVCLTCEGLAEGHEIFESSRRAAVSLRDMAVQLGEEFAAVTAAPERSETAMGFLERELFAFGDAHFDAGDRVRLVAAQGMSDECEAAAAHCLRLVRSGCRWRDIAVAVRGYEDYRPVLETTFARYGVPLYSSGKSELVSKPLVALIREAYDAVGSGWDCAAVSAYVKTGLSGLTPDEALELCDYAWLWDISGRGWQRVWRMHPEGYGGKYTDETAARLERLNALRERVAVPLLKLEAAGRTSSAAAQAMALAQLFEDIELPETLRKRAFSLREAGLEREAGEYVQLWDIIVSALEQCAAVLGDMSMTQEEFSRLLLLMLSQYDVGTIPLTLDRVLCGDMDRMRRRHIKHLLILGCDSERIPLASDDAGLLSDDDRRGMTEAGLEIGNLAADRLDHEFALIYNCATLPGESIYLSRSLGAGEKQPSFIFSRCARIFGLSPERADIDVCRAMAERPAFELAASPERQGKGSLSTAAAEYFKTLGRGDEISSLRDRALAPRGRLGERAAAALYGRLPTLSASRVDRFESCRFSYFMQYGLRARPKRRAAFSPPEMGSFMHFVLEGTAREVDRLGGFKSVSEQQVGDICEKYVEKYISEELGGFDGKTPRFIWLFTRLRRSVRRVVLDMAEELKGSDFRPLDFELDFSELGAQSGSGLHLTGIADRVDGWVRDDKLYLRVVDYKTGRKKFSLSDVWYGMGLQMLLYLFTLERVGPERYGREVVPAGVMYVPARDSFISAQTRPGEEEISAESARQKRRSGLLLDDDAVLSAMENGDSPKFIPVSIKKGQYTGDALATAEQIGSLSRHIELTLTVMARELRAGSIDADPYYRSASDNACINCDFADFCGFEEGRDHRRCLAPLKPVEVWEKLEKEAEENGL